MIKKSEHSVKNLITSYIVLLLLCVICCTGCGSSSSSKLGYNPDEKIGQLLDVIHGASDIYELKDSDKEKDGELNNSYCLDGTVYMQVNRSMFRFELDSNGNITNYVKYKLEG